MNHKNFHTIFACCLECNCTKTISYRKARKNDVNDLPLFVPSTCSDCIAQSDEDTMSIKMQCAVSKVQSNEIYKTLSGRYRVDLPISMLYTSGRLIDNTAICVPMDEIGDQMTVPIDTGTFNTCEGHTK